MSQSSKQLAYFRWMLKPGAHWAWLSILLYVIACFLPAMPPIMGSNPIYGWECLASLLIGIPAWWANPAYFLSLIFYWCRWGRVAAALSGIAAALACSFELMGLPNNTTFEHQEVGCYVWIISLQILACNVICREWLRWREQQERLTC